jgi:hypothetical protein
MLALKKVSVQYFTTTHFRQDDIDIVLPLGVKLRELYLSDRALLICRCHEEPRLSTRTELSDYEIVNIAVSAQHRGKCAIDRRNQRSEILHSLFVIVNHITNVQVVKILSWR